MELLFEISCMNFFINSVVIYAEFDYLFIVFGAVYQ